MSTPVQSIAISAGDTFKAGVLGKGMTDEAKITFIDGSLARISVSQRDINISKAALKSKEIVKSVNRQEKGETFWSADLGLISSLHWRSAAG